MHGMTDIFTGSSNSSVSKLQAALTAANSRFAAAQQNRISGLATLAAKAGLARINAKRKAQSASMLKQIDSAQASMNQAKVADEMKKKYYVYTLPAVIVETSTPTPTVDTTA